MYVPVASQPSARTAHVSLPFHIRYVSPQTDGRPRVERPAPHVNGVLPCTGTAAGAVCRQAARALRGRGSAAQALSLHDAIPQALWRPPTPITGRPSIVQLSVPAGDARHAVVVQLITVLALWLSVAVILTALWHMPVAEEPPAKKTR